MQQNTLLSQQNTIRLEQLYTAIQDIFFKYLNSPSNQLLLL